jgi:Putative beta-barrel porin-2, OmpL-like. bbp2
MKTFLTVIVITLATTVTAETAWSQSITMADLDQQATIAPSLPVRNAIVEQPAPFALTTFEYVDETGDDDDSYGDDSNDDSDDGSDYGSCRAQNFGWYSDGCCCGCYDHHCCDTDNWYWGGWVQQGITFNGYNPSDGFNGVVGLNDFANQWQMNQLWLYAEKCVDSSSCNVDYGGKVDVVYGTDAEYFQMTDGLEENWHQTSDYQVAILQFYLDLGWNDWELRVGRFYAPLGYESYEATDSFFYSKSYTFMYGTPGTLLGAQLTRNVSDNMSLMAGIHRGADQFDDTDGKNTVGFVGGGSWWSTDECTWLDAYVMTDEYGPNTDAFTWSVMGGSRIACFDYMIEGNAGYGWGPDGVNRDSGTWYGVNQHLTRQLSTNWAAGTRFEWFRDDDGSVVTGWRERNPTTGPFIGNFYELTFAANYTPCCNFSLRPEVRWDWYEPDQPGGPLPFDDQTKSNQFLVSLDAIYVF